MTGTQGTPSIGVGTKIDGVTIEYVEKLPVPVGKIGKIPLTNQDSGYGTETMPGRYDPGDTQLSGIYATGKTGINKLIEWQNDRVIHAFQIEYPNGTIVNFNGYLGTFSIVETSDRLTYQIDVSVLGIPAYSNDKTALTTPFFSITDASNNAITALTPAASATGGDYVVVMATDDTGAKITPTCGTANSTIYVGAYNSSGVWVDTAVTSGSASGVITLGSAGSLTDAVIKVTTTGKGDEYYFVTFVRPGA